MGNIKFFMTMRRSNINQAKHYYEKSIVNVF